MPFDAPAIADVLEAVVRSALAPIVERVKALESSARLWSSGEPPASGSRCWKRSRPCPGPPGPAGLDGDKGADGVGLAVTTVDYDGERTFTHRWGTGEKTIALPFKTPLAIYRGVFLDGKIYERGDLVTVNGSIYHCDTDTTSRPGDGSKDWTLAVKRGKDDRGSWPR